MQRDGLRDFITEGVLTGEDLKKILTDNPYDTSDIWDALHDHRYDGFRIGEKVLDEEIWKFGEEVSYFGNFKEVNKNSKYRISKTSEEALAKLMFKWFKERKTLF